MNYVYCVINKGLNQCFGKIGVEDEEVYTIPYKDISLVVHISDKEPKLNEENHLVCHQYVTAFFTKKFNTVVPFDINTFINEDKVKTFLEKNYETFKKNLEKLKDKSEFIVQIFYEPKPKKPELKGSVKDYISKQKKLRKKVIKEVTMFRERFYNQIKEVVDEVKIREDKDVLLSVSCLLNKDKTEELESLLKNIGSLPRLKVKISGPWTVCSFVTAR